MAADLGYICLVHRKIYDDGNWVLKPAVEFNDYSGGGAMNFVGNVAYNTGYFDLGNYGVDTDANIVWAVLNHNSEFSVGIVPEPTGLGIVGMALLALRKKRS